MSLVFYHDGENIIAINTGISRDFQAGAVIALRIILQDQSSKTVRLNGNTYDLYDYYIDNFLNFYSGNDNKYNWWIDGSVYSFNTFDFVQGFIFIAEELGVDFRNYINGPPYSYRSNNSSVVVWHTVEGYDIQPYLDGPRMTVEDTVFTTDVVSPSQGARQDPIEEEYV